MALITANFGLIKPELTDPADITALNKNWDKIDEQLLKAGESGGSDLAQTELGLEIEETDNGVDEYEKTVIKGVVNETIEEKDVLTKPDLTASNGVFFQFAVNEKGEYGHIVTDSEGADTFHPFKNLVRDTPATAIASDLTEGVTAWVNGVLITGTRPAPLTSLTGTLGVSYWGDETWSRTVVFEKAFDEVPTVTATFSFSKNGSHYTGHTISNVTRTGFQIVARGDGNGSQGISGTCTWYARL